MGIVHRILVRDRGLLHRDISWGNVLINHVHLEGGGDNMHDHAFIDNILEAVYVLVMCKP